MLSDLRQGRAAPRFPRGRGLRVGAIITFFRRKVKCKKNYICGIFLLTLGGFFVMIVFSGRCNIGCFSRALFLGGKKNVRAEKCFGAIQGRRV